MADIKGLIGRLARRELEMHRTRFVAPCVAGSPVRTRICGLVHTFAVRPDDFSGMGIFRPENSLTAVLVSRADKKTADSYLGLFPRVVLRLVAPLNDRGGWLALPATASDRARRIGEQGALKVHLVEDAARFDVIAARWDGASLWFERRDFSSDPIVDDYLRSALAQDRAPDELSKKGLTPEDRQAYAAAYWSDVVVGDAGGAADRSRIRRALQRGGGHLVDLAETQSGWRVEWAAANGERHCSYVTGGDLTVIGAGICLSGEDRKFDLLSLVGVVENRW